MSWNQLYSIIQNARLRDEQEKSEAPTACPNDGTPLEHARGVYHCPFDGWTWNGSSESL